MRYPLLAVLLVVGLGAWSCDGSGGDGGSGGSGGGSASTAGCPAPPPAMAGKGALPASFPVPDGVVLTRSRSAGPSTIVEGYAESTIKDLFAAYRAALDKAPYSVTKNEQEAHDAEVNFEGDGASGQVRLGEACPGRISVDIVARPL